MEVSAAVHKAIEALGATRWYSVLHQGRWIQTLRLLQHFAPVSTHSRVLEIGVWPGYQSLAIAKLGYDVTGIDLQPTRLPSLPFAVQACDLNSAEHLPVPEHSVDVVVATEIIEHLAPERVITFLTAANDALRSGGILLITTPNRHHLGSMLRPRAHGTDNEGHGHTKEYTVQELTKLFGDGWLVSLAQNVDMYGGVGKISNTEYYRPLRDFLHHPQRIHNVLKIMSGCVQWLVPATRDTVVVVAQASHT